jgi:hypothetical protein
VDAVNHSQSIFVSINSVIADTTLIDDVRAAISELPSLILEHLAQPLLGVFVGQNVGSSAITDVVSNAQGEVLGAVVLLDADAFSQRTANAWVSWKENSVFESHTEYGLTVRIADAAADNRQNALQFLLLHEFGHVMNVRSEALPKWWQGAAQYHSTEEYDFLACSWQIAMNGEVIPLLRNDFPRRDCLKYYQPEKLPAEFLLPSYLALSKTSFPSLYAAVSCYEDYAESFATYVHCVMLGKPWELHIDSATTRLFSFPEFWHSDRARKKRAVLEAELGIY